MAPSKRFVAAAATVAMAAPGAGTAQAKPAPTPASATPTNLVIQDIQTSKPRWARVFRLQSVAGDPEKVSQELGEQLPSDLKPNSIAFGFRLTAKGPGASRPYVLNFDGTVPSFATAGKPSVHPKVTHEGRVLVSNLTFLPSQLYKTFPLPPLIGKLELSQTGRVRQELTPQEIEINANQGVGGAGAITVGGPAISKTPLPSLGTNAYRLNKNGFGSVDLGFVDDKSTAGVSISSVSLYGGSGASFGEQPYDPEHNAISAEVSYEVDSTIVDPQTPVNVYLHVVDGLNADGPTPSTVRHLGPDPYVFGQAESQPVSLKNLPSHRRFKVEVGFQFGDGPERSVVVNGYVSKTQHGVVIEGPEVVDYVAENGTVTTVAPSHDLRSAPSAPILGQ